MILGGRFPDNRKRANHMMQMNNRIRNSELTMLSDKPADRQQQGRVNPKGFYHVQVVCRQTAGRGEFAR